MNTTHIMVIGEKETFLVRVVLNKLKDAGYTPVFVPYEVNAINREWEKSALIICYMDTGQRPTSAVVNFLMDKQTDDERQLILVGDKDDIATLRTSIPDDQIYRAFERPLDNEVFVKTVKELLGKMEAGEFRRSILVVDDDPSYLNLVRTWLKNTYKVSPASILPSSSLTVLTNTSLSSGRSKAR